MENTLKVRNRRFVNHNYDVSRRYDGEVQQTSMYNKKNQKQNKTACRNFDYCTVINIESELHVYLISITTSTITSILLNDEICLFL